MRSVTFSSSLIGIANQFSQYNQFNITFNSEINEYEKNQNDNNNTIFLNSLINIVQQNNSLLDDIENLNIIAIGDRSSKILVQNQQQLHNYLQNKFKNYNNTYVLLDNPQDINFLNQNVQQKVTLLWPQIQQEKMQKLLFQKCLDTDNDKIQISDLEKIYTQRESIKNKKIRSFIFYQASFENFSDIYNIAFYDSKKEYVNKVYNFIQKQHLYQLPMPAFNKTEIPCSQFKKKKSVTFWYEQEIDEQNDWKQLVKAKPQDPKFLKGPDKLINKNNKPLKQQQIYNPQNKAKCMNGQKPVFYYGEGKMKQRYFMFLDGNNWVASPKKRLENVFRVRKPVYTEIAKRWPYRYYEDYTQIYVNYCDGTIFTGNVEEIQYEYGKQFFFRGFENMKAFIRTILIDYDLQKVKQFLLYGCSSGGWAVFLFLDYIAEMINEFYPEIEVVGISDGGFYLNNDDFYFTPEREFMKFQENVMFNGFYKYFKENPKQNLPNSKCLKFYEGEEWRCLFAEYNLKFIKSRILIVQSAFDFIHAEIINNVRCFGADPEKPGFDNVIWNLDNCSEKELEISENYRKKMLNLILETVEENKIKGQKNISLWMPGCLVHCWTKFKNDNAQIPSGSGNSLSKIMKQFLTTKDQIILYEEKVKSENECN